MFGTSGVRGPFGEAVTADLALDVGRALAIDGAERVVVGRDPRTTGPVLADALSAGLRECGADVVALGLAATPTIARSVAWQDADAGVAITASHNPPEDNGVKLWQPSGMAFDEARRERIAAVVADLREDGLDGAAAEWDAVGAVEEWADSSGHHRNASDSRRDASGRHRSATGRHRAAIRDALGDAAPLDLSVAVDVGNGAGGVTANALRDLGCDVETLNAEPDGHFPSRPSEPTREHLASLRAHVGATDADLGIAHDGDADRTLAVDGSGAFVGGDALLALFARDAVERALEDSDADDAGGDRAPEQAGDARAPATDALRVAVPVDTSLAVEETVRAAGGEVVRTRVGDVFVAERAREDGVVFGGEPSGAWIWPEATLAPDGPYAACRLAIAVARGGALAEQVAALEVDAYPIRRENHETKAKREAVAAVAERAAERYDAVSDLDGVRVETDDGWFLVRASGTQPLVRLTAQAREERDAEALLEEARSLLESAR